MRVRASFLLIASTALLLASPALGGRRITDPKASSTRSAVGSQPRPTRGGFVSRRIDDIRRSAGDLVRRRMGGPTRRDRENEAFSRLQSRLDIDGRRRQMHVVVPSLSLDQKILSKITGVEHYEQRSFFKLLRLANPNVRMTLVTSAAPDKAVIDYYLNLLPNPQEARERLEIISLGDRSSKALSEKLMSHKHRDKFDRLKELVRGEEAHLSTFNVSDLEQRLALELDAPLDGNPPANRRWGIKVGNREIFADAGVRHPRGTGEVRGRRELVAAIDRLLGEQPELSTVVVKLNDGVSGEGNARLDTSKLRSQSGEARLRAIDAALPDLRFEAPGETWRSFGQQIAAQGAIVEAWVHNVDSSPSVQGFIHPDGRVEIRSTHEQILDGQVYKGARYPAAADIRPQLEGIGRKVGRTLAERGVRGTFAIDTVVSEVQGVKIAHAIEINVREGGTTHPYQTARALIPSGDFHYVATDNVVSERLVGREPAEIIRALEDAGLAFDKSSRKGVVLHMMGAVREHGKVGFTAIAGDAAEAQRLFDRAQRLLEAGGDRAAGQPKAATGR